MLIIGLTGNIGSGKSTVTEIFKILGVAIYNADVEAKKFLSSPEIYSELINKFGDSILTNCILDKKKLANLVFSDVQSLKFLNNLIHPLIKIDFDQWISNRKQEFKYVILEAAILFESGFNQYVDKTILVTAPEKQRMQRVCKRDKISEEQFLQREVNQWEENRKVNISDFHIVNDETQLIVPQIIEMHKQFSKQ